MQLKYTLKIPVTVEAMQVTAENAKWAARWCRGVVNVATDSQILGINIPTLYGVQRAPLGSFLIKKTAGDFTYLHPKDFDSKYKLVD